MADDGFFQDNNNKADTDQRPPYSIEAERAILGAMLYDNEIYYRINTYLKLEHFYDPVHQIVFEACETLIDRGRVASPLAIDAYLSANPTYKENGGRENLERLAASVPTTASADDYAKIVFDLATCRGLMQIGGEMIERGKRAALDDPPEQQLEDAEKNLYGLAETGKYGGGFKTFRSAIATAIDIADAAIQRGGGLSGVSTGLDDLDNMLGGLHSSDLLILAGRPSMGKTALATNIALNAARAYKEEGGAEGGKGAIVGFFSLEMSADQIAMRIIAEVAEVSSHEIRRGTIDPHQFDKIYHAAQELNSLPFYIDDTGGLTIAQLAARARRLKRQHGLGLLVVDYLQLLAGSKITSSANRVQEITEISVGLKALAKELEVPVLALSQLSRQVESRDDKRPQLSDLRESGSIEQDADAVLFVYREEYYLKRAEPAPGNDKHQEWQERLDNVAGVAEVVIGKQRHGPIGNVPLSFKEQFTKFGNLDRGYYDSHRNE